jgi:hypothetical protein
LAALLLCALGDTSFQQHLLPLHSPLLHATLCCHSGDPCCARYMRVCADDVRLHSLTSCISWSIHTCPQVYERCRTPFNNTAAHLRSYVPLCSLLCCCTLLLLLPIAARCLSAAGSVRSLGNAACRSWLVCVCTVVAIFGCSPAGSLVVSAVLFDAGCGCALAGPSYTAISCAHCALAYRLHSAEHSPSVVLCTLSRHQIKTSIILCISPEKSAHLLGLKIKQLVCLWVRWGDCGPQFLHCQLTHR